MEGPFGAGLYSKAKDYIFLSDSAVFAESQFLVHLAQM
jgi:hypothetical protein